MNGEANFDIDEEEKIDQLNLFGNSRSTKVQSFQNLVREKILSRELSNNFEVFNLALEEGHIGKHAADVLKKMKRDGEIDFDNRSPLVTYDNVFKREKRVEYRIATQ